MGDALRRALASAAGTRVVEAATQAEAILEEVMTKPFNIDALSDRVDRMLAPR